MNELYLLEPTPEMEAAAMAYRQEYLDCGEPHINGSCGFSHFSNYRQWLERVNNAHKRETSWIGLPATTYFSIRKSDDKIIGTIQLRHELNEDFSKRGGHIGYAVRPPERGKGYGTQQLALVLDAAKSLGLCRVMISCGQDNPASAKTALKNGATLSWEGWDEEDGDIQIYWIEL
ncbi:MAG: GNAT family N-acetyltransferase [Angelakisella sp.]|nr:GNAT family N-acetyltransferase [Angelakisella sp.]